MFRYLNLQKQLINERRKNEQLTSALRKSVADMEYIAMMCDVELDTVEDDNIQEVENNESEVRKG